MSYVHFTRTPGVTIDDYHAVGAAMGDAPIDGRRSHWAGMQDASLCTVDIWESRAHADRFAAERLFPAFEAAGIRPGPDTQVVAFDAEERDDV